LDVFLSLDRAAGAHLHAQLEERLREAVRSGRLRPGAAVPSTRALARELGVSRGVVSEAYAQLAAEGYLAARRGSGTVVAASAAAPLAAPAPPPPPPVRLDLRSGMPDLAAFPRARWAAAYARAARETPAPLLGEVPAAGAPALREALAAYLGRARGVVADPERIVVTSGLRQGLGLLWRALRAGGARRVGVEDPGWRAQRETALDAGLEPVSLPVDASGVAVDALDLLALDAVVVTPAHHFPTGAVLAPERRAALLRWARARGALLVEDDYDAEYRYDRGPVGALQGLAPDRVVYAGTASKTLAPVLRLGWLLVPPPLVAPLREEKARADRGSALLEQLALAELVARGGLDRHLRRTRRAHRRRREALLAALARALPGARVEGVAAGLHVVLRLPEGVEEAAVVAAARARGVLLEGLAEHARDHPWPPAVLIGYANLPEAAVARAAAEVAAACRAAGRGAAAGAAGEVAVARRAAIGDGSRVLSPAELPPPPRPRSG
jgi:GntR family transcriptional regulator/MocR family aminotransferase